MARRVFRGGCCAGQDFGMKKMTDDDIYEIDSVPRFADFGDIGRAANETVGDRFFDFMASKDNKENCQQLKPGMTAEQRTVGKREVPVKPVESEKKDPGTIRDDDDDPLGLRKLAMFRPPRRSRDLAQMAQQKVEQSQLSVKEMSKRTEVKSAGSIPRPRSSSLNPPRSREKPVISQEASRYAEVKTVKAVVVRARSGSFDIRPSRERLILTQETSKRTEVRNTGPVLRSRSSSLNPPRSQERPVITQETDKYAKVKSVKAVTVHARPGSIGASRNQARPVSNQEANKRAEVKKTGPVLRPRSSSLNPPRGQERPIISQAHAKDKSIKPVIVHARRSTVEAPHDRKQPVIVEAPHDRKQPIIVEASHDRKQAVPSQEDRSDSSKMEPCPAASVNSMQPKTSNLVQPKTSNAKNMPRRSVQVTNSCPVVPTPGVSREMIRHRRTSAERDAFFARLSTPKFVNAVKKSEGDTPKKTARPLRMTNASQIPLGGLKTRVLRSRTLSKSSDDKV